MHNELRITAVGDIMLDTELRAPAVLLFRPSCVSFLQGYFNASPVYFQNNEHSRQWLAGQGISLEGLKGSSHVSSSRQIVSVEEANQRDFPFRLIKKDLTASDVVFGNLESPLSSRGRPIHADLYYCASPEFAETMSSANITALSLSNNHCMDFGEVAFQDTLASLERAGIASVGAFAVYPQHDRARIIEKKDIRVGFLAYNAVGPEVVFASPSQCGVIPLNEPVVLDDIASLRPTVDWIILSLHWGKENVVRPSPDQVRLAHLFIDSGADIIFGHHSHVPGPIEMYKGRPIFYSLGNFIFGHGHDYWTDNIVSTVTVSRTAILDIEVFAVSSLGKAQYQPYRLCDANGEQLLRDLATVSSELNTSIAVHDGCAHVQI
jgi:poly-gamma-glutamate capsule biosynthesis protein CapA/YwtB (metallophosphatase superfamily)